MYIFVKPGISGDDDFYVREYDGGPKMAPLNCNYNDMGAYPAGIFARPVLDYSELHSKFKKAMPLISIIKIIIRGKNGYV